MSGKLFFNKEEYSRRIRKTQESMDRKGIELLLVMDPANMNYLTGYDGWSFYVHQGVIVSLDDEMPFWFGREQDSNGARLTSWLDDNHILGYPDTYVQSRYMHTMQYVGSFLKDQGWNRKNIGLEMDGYWFNARMFIELEKQLGRENLLDATNLVNWIKTVKSAPEIEYMRQASVICTNVMKLAVDRIKTGVWEKDAAAAVAEAQIAGSEQYGGDFPAIIPIMPSAERTSSAHLTYDPDRIYRDGDVVLLELAGARHHYHAPLSRTVFLGTPPDELKKISDVVINGLNNTLGFIKPGVTAEEVEAKWRSNLRGTGVEKPSRVGYSYGLNYVPDWGEHTVSLRPGDKTVLVQGMTIHFMPGIWLDKFGFECSEPFLVTEKGCEKFIDFPQKLFIK